MQKTNSTIKRFITAAGCLAAVLLITFSARANYLAEDFKYTGTLDGQNGGLGFAGAWVSGTSHAVISAGNNLAYSAGGYNIAQTNASFSLYNDLAAANGYRGGVRFPAANLTNVVWFSALMTCSNSTSQAYIGFNTINTNAATIPAYQPSSTYGVGISNNTLVVGYGCSGLYQYTYDKFYVTTNNTLTQGSPHLIIGCITFQAYGSSLDSLQVWADPPDLTHLGAPQWQETAHDIGTNFFDMAAGSVNFGAVDAIRFSDGNGNVTNAYTEVTGATNLNAFPATPIPPTLLAEDFNYASGSLVGSSYNGGTGWAGPWSGTTARALVSGANSLTYSAGHYGITQSNVSGSLYCDFTGYRGGLRYAAIPASGEVWFSALMIASNSTAQAYLGFNSANTNTATPSANYMPSTTYNVGISNNTLVVDYGTDTGGNFTGFTATTNNTLTQGSTHLILGRLTFQPSGNTTIALWADPANLNNLNVGAPQWTQTAYNIGSNLFNVTAGGVNFGAVDAIRISGNATAYSDVTGATNLFATVSINPANAVTGNGSNFTFTATTTGTILGYQWALNGVNLSYGTSSTLTVTNASAAARGFYSVTVTNLGTTNSASAFLAVTNCNQNLVWTGGAASAGPGLWDSASTNWVLATNLSTVAFYGDGDNVVFTNGTANLNITNNAAVNPNSVAVSGGSNYTFYGSAIAGGGSVTVTSSGTTVMNNTNAYTGGTIINNGAGSFRTTPGGLPGNVTINSGNLFFQNASGTYAGNISGAGGAVSAISALNGFTATLSGNLSYAGGLNINSGTVILSGNNSYTGQTTVGNTFNNNNPVLQMGSATALPNGSGKGNVFIQSQTTGLAKLDLNGYNVSINGLTGATNTILGYVTNSQSSTPVTLTVGNGDATADYPCLLVGNIRLTKVGNGIQTLSGANSYSGATTISNGTLLVNGSLAAGSAVTNYSTLGGNGTIGGNLVFASGAVATNIAGSPLTNSGTLTLNGNTINVSTLSALTRGTYLLLTNTSGTSISGSFNTVPVISGAGLAANTTSNVTTTAHAVYLNVNVTPTVTVNVGTYTYNGSAQGPNSVTTSPTPDNGTVSWSYAGTATDSTTYSGTTPPTKAGSYTATATVGADSANNLNTTSSSATAFTIATKTSSVTADAKSKTYGDANPALTATEAGTVNGDVLNYTLATDAAQFSSVGVSNIFVNLGSNPNYSVLTTNGTLSINPAATFVRASSTKNPSGYKDTVAYIATLPSDATGSVVFSSTNGAFSTNTVSSGSATSLSITNLPRGTNVITVAYLGDGNYLGSSTNLEQIVTNHPPVANVMTVTRTAGLALIIALSDVATNWTDNPDGDHVSLTGVTMQSTNGVNLFALNWSTNLDGSIVATNAYAFIGYTNSPNVNDQISYSISDGQGGTNIGYVDIVIQSSVTGTNSITAHDFTSPYSNTITAYGIPTFYYVLERATNLTSPVWVEVQTNQAATNGVINAADTFWDLGGVKPSPSAFYQLKWQP